MVELGYLNYLFANFVPGWQMAELGYVNFFPSSAYCQDG